MNEILARLKQRKLVQWAIAYVAGAWAVLQILALIADSYHWPDAIMHLAFGVLALGFVVLLLLAWYHGERGIQRVSSTELLIIALVLAVGGAWLWRFERGPLAGSAPARSAIAVAGRVATRTAPSAVAAKDVITPVPAGAIPAKSIAVLPFENLSTDKGNAYFADGMQDLILTKLADIGDLKVISRTSTAKYASHPDDLKVIGQQLGVATILEGSVQKASNQVLINVQLIDARTDGHIWAQSYTRTLDNVFGVEGEVAQKVADELNAKLTASQASAVAAVPTHNPQAFDAYLRGEGYAAEELAGRFTAVPKAVATYKQAVALDPRFALAWAKLAYAQSLLMYASIDTSRATRDEALAHAQHALALAPDLPQAHFALGYVYRFDFADYAKALAEFEIARKGLPNNAEVVAAIAYIQALHGDLQAAAGNLERAAALDPRNPNLALSLGDALTHLRQYDAAKAALQRVLAVAPDDPEAYADLAHLQVLASGNVDAALAQLADAPAALQADPAIVDARARMLLLKQDYPAARRAVAALKPGGRFVAPVNVALLRASVARLSGNVEGARKSCQQALALAKATVANGGEPARRGDFFIAVAEAGLGRKAEALRALSRARVRLDKSGFAGAGIPAIPLARLYVMLGEDDQAIATLEKLLAGPVRDAAYRLLELQTRDWDPIRKDPRFQALLKKYENVPPAATSSGAAP